MRTFAPIFTKYGLDPIISRRTLLVYAKPDNYGRKIQFYVKVACNFSTMQLAGFETDGTMPNLGLSDIEGLKTRLLKWVIQTEKDRVNY